jgi:hypothetical protein
VQLGPMVGYVIYSPVRAQVFRRHVDEIGPEDVKCSAQRLSPVECRRFEVKGIGCSTECSLERAEDSVQVRHLFWDGEPAPRRNLLSHGRKLAVDVAQQDRDPLECWRRRQRVWRSHRSTRAYGALLI